MKQKQPTIKGHNCGYRISKSDMSKFLKYKEAEECWKWVEDNFAMVSHSPESNHWNCSIDRLSGECATYVYMKTFVDKSPLKAVLKAMKASKR